MVPGVQYTVISGVYCSTWSIQKHLEYTIVPGVYCEFLGVMESNSASVDRAETVNKKMEEEMDESLLDETEEKSVAKAATASARDSSNSNKRKESCQSEGSVGSLATSFMKNVVVGSNEVFTAPKFTSHLTNSLTKCSKGSDQDKPCGGTP